MLATSPAWRVRLFSAWPSPGWMASFQHAPWGTFLCPWRRHPVPPPAKGVYWGHIPLLSRLQVFLLNLLLEGCVGSAGPVSVFRGGAEKKGVVDRRQGEGEKQRGQYTQVAGRNRGMGPQRRTCSEVECLGSAARRPGYVSLCAPSHHPSPKGHLRVLEWGHLCTFRASHVWVVSLTP